MNGCKNAPQGPSSGAHHPDEWLPTHINRASIRLFGVHTNQSLEASQPASQRGVYVMHATNWQITFQLLFGTSALGRLSDVLAIANHLPFECK